MPPSLQPHPHTLAELDALAELCGSLRLDLQGATFADKLLDPLASLLGAEAAACGTSSAASNPGCSQT